MSSRCKDVYRSETCKALSRATDDGEISGKSRSALPVLARAESKDRCSLSLLKQKQKEEENR